MRGRLPVEHIDEYPGWNARTWLVLRSLPYITTIEYASRRIGLVHTPGAPDLWRCWDRLEQWTERVRREEQWKPTPRGAMLQESLLWADAGTHAGKQDNAKLTEAIRDVDLASPDTH